MSAPPPSPGAAAAPAWRRYRWLLALAAAVGAYAIAGFFLAPWLVQRELPALLRDATGREARVGAVEINPFALTLRLRDLQLREPDGTPLAALEELRVDVELRGILRRALAFSEISLTGPWVNARRDADGAINLLQGGPAAPPPAADTAAEPLPRVVIDRLRIERGVVDFTDRVPATEFRTRAGPFDVTLEDLSTLPDDAGRHQVALSLESGTRVTLAGELVVQPLRVNGQFALKGPALGTLHRYIRDQLGFQVAAGEAEASGRFAIGDAAGGGTRVALDDLDLRLAGVRLTATDAPDFLAWSEVRVSGGRLRWPEAQAGAARVLLAGVKVRARRDADGELDVVRLLTPRDGGTADATVAAPAAGGPEWALRVDEVAVADLGVELTDAGPATPAVLGVSDLDLVLRGLSNQPGARMPVEMSLAIAAGGTLGLKGEVGLLPAPTLDADLVAQGIRLAQFQPWVTDVARVAIHDGSLAVDAHVTSGPEESLALEGDVRIAALETYDAGKNERLLAWRELGLDDVSLSLSAGRARITRIRLERPYGRVFIARDQSTNIGDLLVTPQAPAAGGARARAAPEPAEQGTPLRLRIGEVQVHRGEVDFADMSLPLPFAARIQDMNGRFTTIDTRSAAPSRIELEGRVDRYGLARVNGQVRVSAPTEQADVTVLFRNIEMAPLSPYTVKFAGRKIARGKINLDLRYQLDQRKLVGANKVVIDELELGEKVAHPEAMDLPLGLAVALLKDADGRIDIDMPVSGSLDDPEFGIGSVLWKAFVNLVTRVVSAPFRLLGSLVGLESADLGIIDFAPGRSDLLPPEREKLQRVAEAMARRPALLLELPAAVDPQGDAAALRRARMEAAVAAEIAAGGEPGSGRALEKRTRRAVEALHQRAVPEVSLESVQVRHQAPPADDPGGRPRLDELAYLDALRADLADRQPVSDGDLSALGAARAAAIAAELSGAGQLPAGRIRSGPRREVSARDGQWVALEIGVGGVAE